MSNFLSALPALLLLVALLWVLTWLSRQISGYILLIGQRITGSSDMAAVALFLIFLPGTIIHEGAHWITAYVLGLKPSKFRVWPKMRKNSVGLGSVSVRSGGMWLDTLVGLAPLLVGALLLVLITHRIFDAYRVTTLLVQGDWQSSVGAFWDALQQPDGALWCYLLFAIGNAMIPSASDRAPAKPIPLYFLLAILIYLLAGFPLDPVSAAVHWLSTPVETLNSTFIFVIVLDILILGSLLVLDQLLSLRVGAPVQNARKR